MTIIKRNLFSNIEETHTFSFQKVLQVRRDYHDLCLTAMQLCQEPSEDDTARSNLRREMAEAEINYWCCDSPVDVK